MSTPADERRRRLAAAMSWTRTQARRGWYWGADYRWFIGAFGRGLADRAAPHGYGHGWRHPVLLIPGVLEEWTLMRPVADRLSAAGHPVHVLPELRNNTITVDEGSEIVAAFLVAKGLGEVVVVAHSKGGLIGKRLLLGESAHKIRHVVAIASPFAGSSLARLVPARTIRALGPDDETILDLAAHPEVNDRITSIYASFDPHIPGGSYLEGARNIEVESMGHFRIMKDPDVLEAVVSAAR